MKLNNPLIIKIAVLAIGLNLVQCTHEPDLAGIPDISFSTQILPILSGNCNSSGCHSNDPSSEFSMMNYNDVINNADVNAGDAKGSKLYQVLFETGEEKMPPNGDLTDKQKKLIFIWIEQGAKDN